MTMNTTANASWSRHPLVILGGVVLAVCTLGSIRAGSEKEIRTQRIVLTDEHGVERAKLFVDEDGETMLEFLDEQGRESVVLAAEKKGGGSLNFYKTDGEPRLTLTSNEGKVSMLMYACGKDMFISNDDHSGPILSMSSAEDGARVMIAYDAHNQAFVNVWGDHGKGSVAMVGMQDGTPHFEIKNAKDEILFEQPVPEKPQDRPEPFEARNTAR